MACPPESNLPATTPKMITRVWCLFEHNPRDHQPIWAGQAKARPGQGPDCSRCQPRAPQRVGLAGQCTALPDGAKMGSTMAMGVMRQRVLTGCVLVAVSAPASVAPAAGAVGPADWPAFLVDPAHTSANQAQTAITPANASALRQKWHFVGDSRPCRVSRSWPLSVSSCQACGTRNDPMPSPAGLITSLQPA